MNIILGYEQILRTVVKRKSMHIFSVQTSLSKLGEYYFICSTLTVARPLPDNSHERKKCTTCPSQKTIHLLSLKT